MLRSGLTIDCSFLFVLRVWKVVFVCLGQASGALCRREVRALSRKIFSYDLLNHSYLIGEKYTYYFILNFYFFTHVNS